MKKTITFIFIIFLHQIIFAQKNQYYDFIKTWNFIKYYHPDVASGKVNADSLFLVTVKNINSKDNFNSVINKLSQNLNKNLTNPAPTDTSKDILAKNQNFNWFRKNGKISSENKNLLNTIYNHRFNFELLKEKLVSDEKKYSFPKTENLPPEYRLLTLAKIQGIVDYLFPHKYIMDKGFDDYFKNCLEENSKINSRKDFEVILAKLVSKFKDSHAFSFYTQLNFRGDIFNGLYYAPFDYQIVDDHLLITDIIFPEICSKAKLNIGDQITEIDGKSIKQIIDEKSKLLSVSNRNKLIYELSKYQGNLIWPNNNKQKKLTVKSQQNKKFITSIDFADPKDKSQNTAIAEYVGKKIMAKRNHNLVDKNVAYFNINRTLQFIDNVDDDKIDDVMEKILGDAAQKKAIVFDMREYPDWGGFVFHYVYKYFSPVENYFHKYYAPNLKNIGTFYHLDKPIQNFPEIKEKTTHTYSGKVFILVNPETRSASEWYSMSLQKIFPQSFTIGQQTSGGDGDVVKVNLPGDYILEFTGNGIFYPDNSQTQQTGIRINEIVHYKDQDFLDKRDLEFERVLNSIK
ncbi:hypothetical protein IX39_07245 [Chryseobacterium formosense]|uniref:Tail specific protease domain-containing protein n=1 Tax=Chryseobacterium formosense TaxID=236814 RepID=A0A085Z7L9_9FLAO|nr:S41 family peptidase [Chryseobacterium formosense]KFF00433.1 hypothetical protein IX39_07245 [Chryseobacterium formosense]SFT33854.1 C-terminal processing protease CtpA/Prc, contains a PDZ domain [Chryseobacterium formosense]